MALGAIIACACVSSVVAPIFIAEQTLAKQLEIQQKQRRLMVRRYSPPVEGGAVCACGE